MAYSVEMPALGESVTEGTVTRWLKQEGDSVAVDEPLLEVSTDKVDTEIPSPAAGVLQRIVVAEDETVDVGAELAVIGDGPGGDGDGGGQGSSAAATEPDAAEAEQPEVAPAPAAEAEPAPTGPEAQAEPQARSDEPARSEPAAQEAQPAPAATRSPAASGTAVEMPALGESVTEGTVTKWLKQVGDTVEVDEPLLEVSTDKVDTEVPSPVAGTVLEIAVAEDETVDVGVPLAVIGDASAAAAPGGGATSGDDGSGGPAPQQEQAPQEQAPQADVAAEQVEQPTAPAPAPQQEAPQQQAPQQQAPQQQAPQGSRQDGAADGGQTGSPYVTPLVRKLAAEHGVDLAAVRGTGVGGRIRKQDVLAAVEPEPAPEPEPSPEPEPQPTAEPSRPAAEQAPRRAAPSQQSAAVLALRGTSEKLSRLRQTIARRMNESLEVSAQLTQVVEVDVTRIARLRERAKADFQAREGVKLTFVPFFALAVVEALKQHPKLNASLDVENNQVIYHGAEHLGIAVDTDRGLLVPVVKDAGDLNLAGLAHRIADLAARTRSNKVTPDELSGGTFTLTNIGSAGALIDTPIINQPQVGILGTGAIVKRAVVVQDEFGSDSIAIRSMAYLPLTYDHRLVDGADAGRFLTAVKQRLEAGAFEV